MINRLFIVIFFIPVLLLSGLQIICRIAVWFFTGKSTLGKDLLLTELLLDE